MGGSLRLGAAHIELQTTGKHEFKGPSKVLLKIYSGFQTLPNSNLQRESSLYTGCKPVYLKLQLYK